VDAPFLFLRGLRTRLVQCWNRVKLWPVSYGGMRFPFVVPLAHPPVRRWVRFFRAWGACDLRVIGNWGIVTRELDWWLPFVAGLGSASIARRWMRFCLRLYNLSASEATKRSASSDSEKEIGSFGFSAKDFVCAVRKAVALDGEGKPVGGGQVGVSLRNELEPVGCGLSGCEPDV